ncbi:MAG: hypothetical protein AAGB34_09605, partial [Planctomycetota bacterium]
MRDRFVKAVSAWRMIMRKQVSTLTCATAFAVLGLAGTAKAQAPTASDFDQPQIWTWGTEPVDPEGRFIRIVKPYLPSAGMTGSDAADIACDTIVSRGLQEGEVTILIQNFGNRFGGGSTVRTDFSRHDNDAVVYPNVYSISQSESRLSIYMANGIPQTLSWVNAFIT